MVGMKRLGLPALCLVLAASAPACSDDDPTGPEAIAGTYQLVSVGGESLPVFLQQAEDPERGTLEIFLSEGELTLSADETYVRIFIGQARQDGEVVEIEEDPLTDTESGTFAVSGATITGTSPPDGGFSGTISGSEITIGSLVFRK